MKRYLFILLFAGGCSGDQPSPAMGTAYGTSTFSANGHGLLDALTDAEVVNALLGTSFSTVNRDSLFGCYHVANHTQKWGTNDTFRVFCTAPVFFRNTSDSFCFTRILLFDIFGKVPASKTIKTIFRHTSRGWEFSDSTSSGILADCPGDIIKIETHGRYNVFNIANFSCDHEFYKTDELMTVFNGKFVNAADLKAIAYTPNYEEENGGLKQTISQELDLTYLEEQELMEYNLIEEWLPDEHSAGYCNRRKFVLYRDSFFVTENYYRLKTEPAFDTLYFMGDDEINETLRSIRGR